MYISSKPFVLYVDSSLCYCLNFFTIDERCNVARPEEGRKRWISDIAQRKANCLLWNHDIYVQFQHQINQEVYANFVME